MNDVTAERGLPPLFDFKAVAGALWRGRLAIAATTVGLVACAIGYVAITPPTFTATASILVDPRDSRATNFDSVLPGIGADSAAIASQVSVIDSRDLLGTVFDSQHLATDPEFSAGGGMLSRIKGLFGQARPPQPDAIYKAFQDRVSVSREGLTYVIDVSFRSHDPEKAARIANAIVDRYKASLQDEAENANRRVTSLLTSKIASLQDAVAKAEREAEDFKFKNAIYDAQSGGTLQAQIDQLTAQLGTAQDDADRAENRYQQALGTGNSPEGLNTLSQILTSRTSEQLRDEYNQRAAALANAQTVYGPQHPTILRLQAELSKVKGLIASEAERIRRQLKASRDLAEDNVRKLQAKLAALRDKSNQSSLAQVQLRQLQGRADAARSVLQDFVNRSQQTAQMQGIQISQVRVINSALPPVQPSWPKAKLLVPVAGILGLFAGCALALILASQGGAATPAAALPAPVGARRMAEDDESETAERSTAPAVGLGRYVLPATDGGTAWSGIKAVRQGHFTAESARLSLGILKLLAQSVQRTQPHAKPFVIVVSSPGDGVERRLAAALIGIGLQDLDETVLLLELERPAGLHSRGAAEAELRLSIDPTSGLPTAPVSAQKLKETGAAAIAAEAAAQIGETHDAFDFALVVARPMGETGFDADSAATADLVIYALSPEEEAAASSDELANRFGSTKGRTALIVVSADTGHWRGSGPKLVEDQSSAWNGDRKARG